MKYLRVTATPDLDVAPQILRLLAASEFVTEARLLDWNFAGDRGATMLYAVTGNREPFTNAVADIPALTDTDVTPAGERRFYVLTAIPPDANPLFGRMSVCFCHPS